MALPTPHKSVAATTSYPPIDVEQNSQFQSAVHPGTRQGGHGALGILQLAIERQLGLLRDRRGVCGSNPQGRLKIALPYSASVITMPSPLAAGSGRACRSNRILAVSKREL